MEILQIKKKRTEISLILVHLDIMVVTIEKQHFNVYQEHHLVQYKYVYYHDYVIDRQNMKLNEIISIERKQINHHHHR